MFPALCRATIVAALIFAASFAPDCLLAQAAGPGDDLRVSWEVKNRFRLFRDERDFLRHVAALQGGSVLEAERTLAAATDGRGWARDTVVRLCVDLAGAVVDTCVRDGVRESYLTPVDHRIGVRLAGTLAPGMTCLWTFEDARGDAQNFRGECNAEVTLRVRYGTPTIANVDVATADGATRRITAEILVRDLLIAGLGDSIAAGEGNPDRPVSLSDDGFCFRQFVANVRTEYFRPGRVGFSGDKSCDAGGARGGDAAEWSKLSARWMSSACHRSLYGYQLRAALALAAGSPHVAVTFLPLACTGATINDGLFNAQRARELDCGDRACPGSVPSQLGQLQSLLGRARQRQPDRQLDLAFLTVGANDINFSGLVADVIIEARAERAVAWQGGVMTTVEVARKALDQALPRDFARLRAALKPFLGGNLERVVYVTYGHPALGADGNACPGGRDGFDVHPAFGADGGRMREVSEFVRDRFLPRIKALATCTGGARCNDGERMSFADAHQPAFVGRGVCARAETDPEFDRECFSPNGDSFRKSPVDAATEPLACDLSATEFRAYAPRARWVRTANDAYFAAMTFPEGVPSIMQAADIHDATWGILSAVYGGAIHPTAEGHAAMADAAVAVARRELELGLTEAPVTVEPLPAPQAPLPAPQQ
jgi:lysophospholipase L1-like esterase